MKSSTITPQKPNNQPSANPQSPSRQKIKVAVLLMGKSAQNNRNVKQLVLDLQPHTKLINVYEYLYQIQRIPNINVSSSFSKNGARLPETFQVSQLLALAPKLQDNSAGLKLFLYEQNPCLNADSTLQILQNNNQTPQKKQQEVAQPLQQIIVEPKKQVIKQQTTKQPQKQTRNQAVAPISQPKTTKSPEQKGCCCTVF